MLKPKLNSEGLNKHYFILPGEYYRKGDDFIKWRRPETGVTETEIYVWVADDPVPPFKPEKGNLYYYYDFNSNKAYARTFDPSSDVCIGHFKMGNVFSTRQEPTNEDLKNILNKLLNKLDRGEESFYYFDFTDFRVKETRYDSVGANRLVDIGNCVKSVEEFTDKKLKTILDNIKKKLEC